MQSDFNSFHTSVLSAAPHRTLHLVVGLGHLQSGTATLPPSSLRTWTLSEVARASFYSTPLRRASLLCSHGEVTSRTLQRWRAVSARCTGRYLLGVCVAGDGDLRPVTEVPPARFSQDPSLAVSSLFPVPAAVAALYMLRPAALAALSPKVTAFVLPGARRREVQLHFLSLPCCPSPSPQQTLLGSPGSARGCEPGRVPHCLCLYICMQPHQRVPRSRPNAHQCPGVSAPAERAPPTLLSLHASSVPGFGATWLVCGLSSASCGSDNITTMEA